MIYKETELYPADNGGAKKMKCIGIEKKKVGFAGDNVIVTVKNAKWNKKVKKGKVYKAVVVQTRSLRFRPFGNYVCFFSNRAVILKRGETVPLGSRVNRFIFFELRKRGFLKLSTLAPGYV